jgi:GntR family transcriptional regulator
MAAPGKGEPRYLRIAADLRASIASGERGPGSRLPGENDLMAAYQVARETARKALAQLINEGIATPRRGAGVYVRAFRPVIRNGIQRLSGQTWPEGKPVWGAEAEGRSLEVDRVQVSEDAPPPRAAILLDLADGARVVIRDRRYLLDGKPVLLARSYLPASLVAGTQVTQPDTGPGGTYARLADLGHAPVRFREDLRARMPEPGEVTALDLPPGTPVIEVIRTAYTSDRQPVEASEMVADAGAYVFRYDFTIYGG